MQTLTTLNRTESPHLYITVCFRSRVRFGVIHRKHTHTFFSASANGHVRIVKYLIEKGAKHLENGGKNTPLHWACLNKHASVVKLLCDSFSELNVLEKNKHGRSALTYAFKSGDTDMIKTILSHSSAEELEKKSDSNASPPAAPKEEEPEKKNEAPLVEASVTHEIIFKRKKKKKKNKKKKSSTKPTPVLKVRELPIVDKTVFNTEAATASEDRTGLALWPASIVLSRWIANLNLSGKSICELGAGCGLPGITAFAYGGAERVVLTDYFEDTVANLAYNSKLNSDGKIVVKAVDWADGFDESFDIVIGADLIYAAEAVPLLLRTIKSALKDGGHFLYVCPDERDGLVKFIESASAAGLQLASCKAAPITYYKNPLKNGTDKECEMFFPGLLSGKPTYRMYDYVSADS